MEVKYNSAWENSESPRVSIITPVYNRRKELPRALSSVETQSCQDFELIVIDDGSREEVDDILAGFMDKVSFPVAFIKKENGGVHTARNAGIRLSRGDYYLQLDSDDELVPDSVEIFLKAWDSIPRTLRHEYREVVGFCQDQSGVRIGGFVPEGINNLPFNQAKAIASSVDKGEKLGMLRGDIMRANLWPEPEGVTFVSEGLNWLILGSMYKSWYINDVVRIYHRETEVSYSNGVGKRSNQQLINSLYNNLWFINNGYRYGLNTKAVINKNLWYNIMRHLLHWRKSYPKYDWAKAGIKNNWQKLFSILLWFPSIFPALLYSRKHSK